MVIFPNGVSIEAKKYNMLSQILSNPRNDRLFINTQFFVFLKEEYIHKQIKKNPNRKAVLEKLRDTSKYDLMRRIFEHRVLYDGSGDTQSRILIFRSVFRVKFNNWWASNGLKIG